VRRLRTVECERDVRARVLVELDFASLHREHDQRTVVGGQPEHRIDVGGGLGLESSREFGGQIHGSDLFVAGTTLTARIRPASKR